MKKTALLVFALLYGFASPAVKAEPHFLDLSKAANWGLSESFDEAVSGIQDLQEKNGLKDLPVGLQTFRGIPFQILDPAKNQGRSFVVLRSRRKPDFPEGVSIQTGLVKASYLYFLQTCRWGGTAKNITVAEYDIVYEDGQVLVVPLRVGMEFTNFFGADDTASSFLAWWHKYKNTEMGLNLFPWKNPWPGKAIQSILFKTLNKMPVPLLFAITASDKELPISSVSPKPEKTFQTDTSHWLPFEASGASSSGTAIDMSFLLDAPAGKHGKVKADGDKLVFEDGTEARFWGTSLKGDWPGLSADQWSRLAGRLAAYGCNLVSFDSSASAGVTANFQALVDVLKPKGIYVDLTNTEKSLDSNFFGNDPAVIPRSLWTSGLTYRNDCSQLNTIPLDFVNDPMVMHPEKSIPFHLTFNRYLGLPYRAEWRNGWPNEYLGETPLLAAAYGSFEDWAACVGMDITGTAVKVLDPDLDFSNKPSLSIQWPVAALAFLRGDLKRGKLCVLKAREEMPDTVTSLKVLAHRSGIAGNNEKMKTDISGELKAKIEPKLRSFVSDTGQITWQGNVGVVQISSPRFQALIGFLSHRKFNNNYWAVETPNSFASLSLISLTEKSIADSDHLLLTAVTRMENTGMVYNQAKTKLISVGTAPILIEPFAAKIVLYRFVKDSKLKIRALDANGQPLKSKVSVRWVKNSLIFSWIPSAFYLEISK